MLADISAQFAQYPPLAALGAAYLGGLAASLTPCVYPMLPITASVIGHANVDGSRLRAFGLSCVHVLGMALTYAALGFFAAASGRLFGAGPPAPGRCSPWATSFCSSAC